MVWTAFPATSRITDIWTHFMTGSLTGQTHKLIWLCVVWRAMYADVLNRDLIKTSLCVHACHHCAVKNHFLAYSDIFNSQKRRIQDVLEFSEGLSFYYWEECCCHRGRASPTVAAGGCKSICTFCEVKTCGWCLCEKKRSLLSKNRLKFCLLRSKLNVSL